MTSRWIRHGFWNTLEHGVTRVADAVSTLLVLWSVAPELFARLALAQAWVAPLLLLFIAPETVLYRDYAAWKAEGPAAVAARIRALRLFGWAKAVVALGISMAAPAIALALSSSPGAADVAWQRFLALVWAFSMALAPQVAGPDREYLRLDLCLSALNAVSLYQKLSLLGGTLLAAWLLPERIEGFTIAAVFSLVSTALLARGLVTQMLARQQAAAASAAAPGSAGAGRSAGPGVVEVLRDALGSFSVWAHLWGVVVNWVQTLDLLLLGVLNAPARVLGLYGAGLKLASLGLALPMALSNSFQLWVGRRLESSEGVAREQQVLARGNLVWGVCVTAYVGVLVLASPWLVAVLSKGRWSALEQEGVVAWVRWFLAGGALFSFSLLQGGWLLARGGVRRMFLWIALPWGVLSGMAYAWTATTGGPDAAAVAHVGVGAVYLLLVALTFRVVLRERGRVPAS